MPVVNTHVDRSQCCKYLSQSLLMSDRNSVEKSIMLSSGPCGNWMSDLIYQNRDQDVDCGKEKGS